MQTRSSKRKRPNTTETSNIVSNVIQKSPGKQVIKKLKGDHYFDIMTRDAELDFKTSICEFQYELPIHLLSVCLQETIRIHSGKPFWILKWDIVLLMPPQYRKQVPIDEIDIILCRATVQSWSVLFTIYGCHEQHVYLSENDKYSLLTSHLEIDVKPNAMMIFDPPKKLKTKEKTIKQTKGIDCMNPTIACLSTEEEKLIDNIILESTQTNLTQLQRCALTHVVQVMDQPYFSLLGGLVKNIKTSKTYLFSDGLLSMIPVWLYNLLQKQRISILSTKGGSGKTLIALLYTLLDMNSNKTETKKISLIIVKNQLIPHWKDEIKKHIIISQRKLFCILDSKQDIINFKKHRGKKNTILLLNFDYLLSFMTLMTNHEVELEVELLVIDEAHSFTNKPDIYNNLIYKKILCITSTPERQYNSIISLIGLHRLNGYFFGKNIPIEATYRNINRQKFFTTKAIHIASNTILKNCVIRGDNHLDVTNIIPESYRLPCSNKSKIIFNNLCYYRYSKSTIRRLFDYVADIDNLNFEQDLFLRKQLSLDQQSFEQSSKLQPVACNVKSDDNCFVCFNSFQFPIQLMVCNHVLCCSCWDRWNLVNKNTRTCPICRTVNNTIYTSPNFLDIPKQTIGIPESENTCKNNFVKERISNLPSGQQLLIYTSDIFRAELYESYAKTNNKSCDICGFEKLNSANTRQSIDRFQERYTKILILNVNKFADGLNFPNVSNLLIVDFFSSTSLLQAIRRIGGSRLNSRVKKDDTWISVLMYDKSVQSWLYQETIGTNNNVKVDVHAKVALLPQINRGKLPSKRNMLELEYFLTKSNPGTRMFKLHELLTSLVQTTSCKKIPTLTFQSGLQRGPKKSKRSKNIEYESQEVSCIVARQKLVFVLGTHSVKLIKVDHKDASYSDITDIIKEIL